jgi:hypothetical protein
LAEPSAVAVPQATKPPPPAPANNGGQSPQVNAALSKTFAASKSFNQTIGHGPQGRPQLQLGARATRVRFRYFNSIDGSKAASLDLPVAVLISNCFSMKIITCLFSF